MKLLMLFVALVSAATLALATNAQAKGEFRNVPKWWINSALCVHSYEGSWTDPNWPYWGGMQMDIRFMTRYGGWTYRHYGTADHWPKNTQLLIAYRGWKVQGWGAWPNTSRMCGLR